MKEFKATRNITNATGVNPPLILYFHLSTYLIFLLIPPIHIYPPTHLPIHSSIHPPIIHPSTYPPTHQPIHHPCVHLLSQPPIHPSAFIHPSSLLLSYFCSLFLICTMKVYLRSAVAEGISSPHPPGTSPTEGSIYPLCKSLLICPIHL